MRVNDQEKSILICRNSCFFPLQSTPDDYSKVKSCKMIRLDRPQLTKPLPYTAKSTLQSHLWLFREKTVLGQKNSNLNLSGDALGASVPQDVSCWLSYKALWNLSLKMQEVTSCCFLTISDDTSPVKVPHKDLGEQMEEERGLSWSKISQLYNSLTKLDRRHTLADLLLAALRVCCKQLLISATLFWNITYLTICYPFVSFILICCGLIAYGITQYRSSGSPDSRKLVLSEFFLFVRLFFCLLVGFVWAFF